LAIALQQVSQLLASQCIVYLTSHDMHNSLSDTFMSVWQTAYNKSHSKLAVLILMNSGAKRIRYIVQERYNICIVHLLLHGYSLATLCLIIQPCISMYCCTNVYAWQGL